MRHSGANLAVLSCLTTVLAAPSALAQLVPDNTLGGELSVVTPDILIDGLPVDLIEGGAERGSNLFHSFLDFNIDEGQRVYFANPLDIENILSRVTGDNASNIFGTLGVDGSANLFLLNPNGIVFGENAALDITGSFYASTGDAIQLEDEVFSAAEPEQSRLLTVNPSVLFERYLTDDSGDIENRGQLAATGDLTLAANQLDLQGQVAAGGDLTLLGLDTVQIRDTGEAPFIGFAGGDLLVQGNEQVDIVALSHPDSGLYSYGDMVLRSANPVGGDAHYWSGGGFRVETLEGEVGALESPVDPIIRSLGDVEFESYRGSSLHIIAGGSVSFDEAVVTAPDPGIQGIDFLQETIELTDGTIVDIDGGTQPTVDIRAGVSPDAVGVLPIPNPSGLAGSDFFINNILAFQPVDPTLTTTPSDAHIEVGSIRIEAPDGLILLTNRYEPNLSLPGDIQVVGNDPLGFGFIKLGINITATDAGSIFLDSRGNIDVTDTDITLLGSNSTGDIVLVAEDDILLEDPGSFAFSGIGNNIDFGGQGTAGDIRITARNLSVLNGAQIDGRLFGNGDAGSMLLNVEDTVLLQGVNPVSGLSSGITGLVETGVQGNAGELKIVAQDLSVLEGAQINSSTFGVGRAGDIRLEIRGTARFDGLSPLTLARSGILSNVQPNSQGEAGDIYIEASNFELLNGATLRSSTFGIGDAGTITLNVRETALFDSNDSVINFSGVFADIQPAAQGQAGEILVNASNLDVLGGTVLAASNFGGVGNGGNVIFDIRDTARFDQASQATSEYVANTPGHGGNVILNAANLDVLNGAVLSTNSFGTGDAGNVTLNIRGTARFDGRDPNPVGRVSGATSDIGLGGVGTGGNVRIRADNLEVLNGARLSTSLVGIGEAGDLILEIRETARFDGIDSLTRVSGGAFSTLATGGQGRGGNVELTATNLNVSNGAQIGSGNFGNGQAGDVILEIRDTVRLGGAENQTTLFGSGIFNSIDDSGVGEGGDIRLSATNLILDGAQIFSGVRGQGEGGDIILTIRDTLRLEDSNLGSGPFSGIFSGLSAAAGGQGGDIRVATDTLEIFDSRISAESQGDGDAGNISIVVVDNLQARHGSIATNSALNAGGAIQISSGIIFLFEDSDIQTFVNSGVNNGGNITIAADFVIALEDSDILAFSTDGFGGDIDLSQTTLFSQNLNFASGNLSLAELLALDGNNRVDINATGGIASGQISINDSSFVENSLNELSDDLVDTTALTAGSCIVNSDAAEGSFVVTGSEGLPQQPGGDSISAYPTGTVQVPAGSSAASAIQEPQSIYRLAYGRLVLSHTCR